MEIFGVLCGVLCWSLVTTQDALTTPGYELPNDMEYHLWKLQVQNHNKEITELKQEMRQLSEQREEVADLKQEIEEQKHEMVHLKQEVLEQKNESSYLKQEMRQVEEQRQEVSDLKQEVGELKQKQNTTVMFSSFLSHWLQITKGSRVVFNQVLTNIGQNYDPNTGVFTCTVPGYYVFDVHVRGDYNDFAIVDIRLNGDRLVVAWADDGFGYTSASAHVSVVLHRGDKVDVTAAYLSSHLYGGGKDKNNMFSGHLVNTL